MALFYFYLFFFFIFIFFLFIFFFFFVQQFKAGYLSLAYEFPRVTNVSYNIQLKHIVWEVGVGVRNVINILFICFWSITEKYFTRVLRLSGKKKKKTRSLSLNRFLHGILRTLPNNFPVIGQN